MIPIVISPSQQLSNKCVMCTSEANHCRAIANELYNILKNDSNFKPVVVPILGGTESKYLAGAVCFSNDFMGDDSSNGFHCCIHTDAYNGKSFGASAFYMTPGGKGQLFTQNILSELSALTPWNDLACTSRPELYELKYTTASAGLFEISYHDEPTQSKWIHDNIINIAMAIAKGIYKTVGLNMPDPYIQSDDWKTHLIKDAFTAGLIFDCEQWLRRKDEPAPVWMVLKTELTLMKILQNCYKNKGGR